jgi:O-antigen ligase
MLTRLSMKLPSRSTSASQTSGSLDEDGQCRFFGVTLALVQLWVTIAVLVLSPLFFGSVDLFWIATWTILLSISALCGLGIRTSTHHNRIIGVFLGVCTLYVLVSVTQVVPFGPKTLNDPSWNRANELLDLGTLPRVSSRAEIPPISVGHFLLFTTSFINGFFIGTSRSKSAKLVQIMQYALLIYVIYGWLALVLTPNAILWAPKLAYRGSLTATFINHNTAGTFVGAGAILWFILSLSHLQSFRFSSIRLMLLTPSNENRAFVLIARFVAALTCFFALLLTGSRGALISTCLGLLAAIVLLFANRQKTGLWQILLSSAVACATTLALVSQMGRIGSQGLIDDARWSVYELCIEAVRQRPLLGAGVGTFSDIFPSLRTNGFFGSGVWDYAHSTILEIAVEMGIPVAVIVLLAALASLLVLARGTVRSEGHTRGWLAAITGIAILSYLHSLVDFSLQIPGYLILFGVLLGCGLARASSVATAVDAV